ncbi:MAG TPA: allantoinase AllB [Actinomycetales bacterium]|nr:allantoinase AllB [Actinomycetales bacterium]
MIDLLVRAPRAVVDGAERPATVAVTGGRIVGVLALDADTDATETVVLAGDEVLLPGLVDTHVHVNEPGRTEWEGFATATRAAAAGGVTTIVDMPLNCLPPTVDVDALEAKRGVAQGQCHVDVGFWGGAVPGNVGQLRGLHEAGVLGFKCFLVDSGVPEFPPLDDEALAAALAEVAALDSVLVVHAEDADVIASAAPVAGPAYRDFVRSRPPDAEDRAVERLLGHAGRAGARAHVLHLSSASAVPLIDTARRQGVRVTAETCPHYLALAAEDVPDGGTQFKCCPPVRDAANRELLWAALAGGAIDLVVTDHSPCTPDLKRHHDFGADWGGIASLQLGLPVVWTAARARGHGLADVVRWMSTRPASLAGLSRKGSIAPGFDADLVIVAPDATFTVDPAALHHRHGITPYAGLELAGVVRRTWLRGRRVTGDDPHGALLRREAPR